MNSTHSAKHTRLTLVAVGVISALTLAACGSKSEDSANTTTAETYAETQPVDGGEPAPTEATVHASDPDYTAIWNWEWSSDSGDLEQATLLAGIIRSVQGYTDRGGYPIGIDHVTNYCGLDPQRDAVAPLKLTQTNGNASFDQLLGSIMVVIPTDGPNGQVDQGVEIFTDYGSKFSCVTLGTFAEAQMDGSGTWDVTCDAVPAGGSCEVNAVLIIRGYYSPQFPNGDTQALGQWSLGQYTFRSDNADLKSWQGPGERNRISPLQLVG